MLLLAYICLTAAEFLNARRSEISTIVNSIFTGEARRGLKEWRSCGTDLRSEGGGEVTWCINPATTIMCSFNLLTWVVQLGWSMRVLVPLFLVSHRRICPFLAPLITTFWSSQSTARVSDDLKSAWRFWTHVSGFCSTRRIPCVVATAKQPTVGEFLAADAQYEVSVVDSSTTGGESSTTGEISFWE